MTDHLRKLYALAVAGSLVTVVALAWGRLGTDFWPLDRSYIGPNIVASILVWAGLLVAGALIYPPTKRALDRWAQRHVDAVHARIERLEAHHVATRELVEEIHHIVHTGEPHPRALARREEHER